MADLHTAGLPGKVTVCVPAARSLRRLGITAIAVLVLGACGTPDKPTEYKVEEFGAAGNFTHNFDASTAVSCEAARRTLLSQGYVITQTKSDLVDGRKSFQPDVDTHLEIEFHVTCAANGKASTVFVNALQERYAIKKTNSSASVGVGALGAVSLPFGSSDDSLVKIASETIQGAKFYDRFFDMVGHYVADGVKPGEAGAGATPTDPAKNDNVLLPDNMAGVPDGNKK